MVLSNTEQIHLGALAKGGEPVTAIKAINRPTPCAGVLVARPSLDLTPLAWIPRVSSVQEKHPEQAPPGFGAAWSLISLTGNPPQSFLDLYDLDISEDCSASASIPCGHAVSEAPERTRVWAPWAVQPPRGTGHSTSDFTSRRWAAAAVRPGAPRCPRAEAYARLPSLLCVPSTLGAAPSPLSPHGVPHTRPQSHAATWPSGQTDGQTAVRAARAARGLCGRMMQPGRRGLSAEGRWAPRTGCKVRPRDPPQCALGASAVGAAAFTQCPWGPSGPLAPSLGVTLSMHLQKLSASRTIEDTFGSLVQALCWDCPFPCVSAPGEAASTARRPCPPAPLPSPHALYPRPPAPHPPAVEWCAAAGAGTQTPWGTAHREQRSRPPPAPGPASCGVPAAASVCVSLGPRGHGGRARACRCAQVPTCAPPSGQSTGQPHGLPQPPASPLPTPTRAPTPGPLTRAHHCLLKEGIGSSLHSMRNHVWLVLCAWIACAGPRGKGAVKQAAGRVWPGWQEPEAWMGSSHSAAPRGRPWPNP